MAANLAYVLARNLGKPTLLIDVDLKSPTVHDCMGTRNFPGLRDVFEEDDRSTPVSTARGITAVDTSVRRGLRSDARIIRYS